MKTALFNRPLLLKSLSAFTISMLGPGVNKAFFKTLQALFTSDHHIERGLIHPFSSPVEQQAGISSTNSNLRAIEGVTEMGWGAYESYIWFMGMMLILEIVIFFVKNFSKDSTGQQIQVPEKPIYQYKEEQEWSHKLKSFTVHIVKTIFISSLCYFIYTVIVVSICLVCSPYNQSRDSTPRQELGFSDLSLRSLEEIPIKSHKQEEKGIHKNHVGAERVLISSPLNSMVVQDIAYSSNISISSTIFSNDGTKALLASYLNSNQTCSFLIADISEDDLTDSVYIGSISFPLTANVGPLSNNSYPLSLALSSDGKTVFMTTPSALQIIDISDPTSPVAKPNLTMPSTDLLYSVTLSPDEQNAFLLRNSSSTGYQIVVIDVESLETTTSLNSSSQPYYSLYTHEQSMFVSVSNLSMWEVYNISDMANITLQGTLNFKSFEGVQSVGFSSDYQTAYVGTSLNGSGYIRIVNISGGVISNIISTTPLVSGFDIDYMASIEESPAGRHLFVAGDPALQIFDISNSTSPISLVPTAIPGPVSMAITSNGQQGIFIEDSGEYYLINFNLNLVLNQAVSLQSNVIGTLNVSSGLNAMALTPDGRTLYMSSANSLTVVNLTNPSNYTMLPSFPVTQPLFQMTFSSDGEYLFALSTSSNKCSFDIYDVLSAQLISSYDLYCDNPQLTQSFVISVDENIAVIADSLVSFVVLDISDKANPGLLSDNTFISASRLAVALLPDGQTAFIGGSTFDISTLSTIGVLNIYDISTPDHPQLLQSYSVESGGIMSFTMFLDASLAYMITKSSNLNSFLTVLDISTPTTPIILNTISLLEVCHDNYATAMIVPMLPNDLVMLISTDSTVLVADISMPELPNYIGAYLSSDSATTNDIGVTYGSNTLLVGVSEGVTMISLKPEYILNFMLDEISMGQTVTLPLNVFTKNSQGTYDASLSNYKFTDLSRYNPVQTNLVFDIVQTYTELDNWVIFDQGTGQLTVATNLKADYQVGTYDLFASISTQIPDTTFIGIGSINDTNSSIDLMVALVGLGYVDNEGYLTSSFDPDQSLLLGSEYMGDEVKIRSAMSKYYIQAWTTFTIMQSLELRLSEPRLSANSNTSISISTPSPKTINMFITLENAQFVTNGYPFSVDFSSNNMQVGIVGSLSSVNDILPQLIIYLNNRDSCDGQVNVTDSLNPTLTESVANNISSHFKISSEPSIDTNTFMDQLNNVSIVTGDQFFIPFSASIFTDSNNQPLTFLLKMQDGSEVPYWLALKGLTLVGTPPMQLSKRDLQVKITASNQYQSKDVDFILSVGLSFEYILKLIATYGGAFITVVGLYVYAARIYNIFAKRFYTYSKKFVIKVGEEVTAKTLYPIAFQGTALQESRLIMSHLDKRILTELKNTKTAATSNALARYFCKPDSYKLDQDKLCQMIEETATSMLRENKTKLKVKLYTEGTDSDRKFIQQLIINRFVIRMLDLNEEKPTKAAFEKIKKEIFSLVDFTACLENGCCKFSVNEAKLQDKFKDCKIKTFSLLAENDEGEIHLLDSEEDPSARKSKVHDSSHSFAKKSQPNQKSLEKELLEVDLPGTTPNQHKVWT